MGDPPGGGGSTYVFSLFAIDREVAEKSIIYGPELVPPCVFTKYCDDSDGPPTGSVSEVL